MLGDKTAVVTGAAGDLGNAMARQLAENGAHIVMWDIVPRADAAAAIERVQTHDPAAEYAEVDVRGYEPVGAYDDIHFTAFQSCDDGFLFPGRDEPAQHPDVHGVVREPL